MKEKSDTDNQASWMSAMRHAWGAIPANDLLDPIASKQQWALMGLQPPTSAEAISFALAGRALKYGISTSIAVPALSLDTATRLMVYLHRLRIDALQGGIRTPWLNPDGVQRHRDVVFISRPAASLQAFLRVRPLRPRIVKPSKNPPRPAEDSGTLIFDGGMDVMALTDQVGRNSKPLVIVVDVTRNGFESAAGIDHSLEECFPETPRILLMSLGDDTATAAARSNRSGSHLWLMRLTDTAITSPDYAQPVFQVHVIPDAKANSELVDLAHNIFRLRTELEKQSDPQLRDRLAIAGKVFRSLNELSSPLSVLEDALQFAARPGRFPIRTLSRWLDVAEQSQCQYGETENQSRIILAKLRAFMSLLVQPTVLTGKTGWLQDRLHTAYISNIQTTVLCGSTHEVTALENWLDTLLDADWGDCITVLPMDGVRAYRQQPARCADLIVLGMLWPSRRHWLATPCDRIIIPAYLYEASQIERQVHLWWRAYGAPSAPAGDKLIQWQLRWSSIRCADADVDNTVPLELDVVLSQDRSAYPARLRHVTVPIEMELDNWLELLLEEPFEARNADQHAYHHRDHSLIHTLQHNNPIPWAATRPVLVLSDKKIVPTLPADLASGDQIILLKQTDERVATQEKLYEMVSESEGMQQIIRLSSRWQSMVKTVASQYSITQVQQNLRREGVSVSDDAVSQWFRHAVIGPRDTHSATLVFARLSKAQNPEKTAEYVAKAIAKVRSMHQHIGQQLRKALLDRSEGADTITLGSLTIEGSTFDDMIEIADVESVVSAHHADSALVSLDLLGIAQSILDANPGRLLFTTPARKSLRASNYSDIEKFKACLELMAHQLYDHYQNKKVRLQDVLSLFTHEGIEFAPKMSATTMGQHTEKRKYKGRQADLNRHLCLGDARDPKRTMRIHFEWDEDDAVLVIHHAGKHLDTTQS